MHTIVALWQLSQKGLGPRRSRPSATFWPAITPQLLARRWTRIGSVENRATIMSHPVALTSETGGTHRKIPGSYHLVMASTPVLATKLFAPARRPQLVARPRLARAARHHPRCRPPADARVRTGRVRQDHRAQRLARPPRQRSRTAPGSAWLSLDDGDNDLTRFLTHLVAALQSAGLDVDAARPRVAGSRLDVRRPDRAGQRRHSRRRAGAGEQWVLVLDDYHVDRSIRGARGGRPSSSTTFPISCTW